MRIFVLLFVTVALPAAYAQKSLDNRQFTVAVDADIQGMSGGNIKPVIYPAQQDLSICASHFIPEQLQILKNGEFRDLQILTVTPTRIPGNYDFTARDHYVPENKFTGQIGVRADEKYSENDRTGVRTYWQECTLGGVQHSCGDLQFSLFNKNSMLILGREMMCRQRLL